MNRYIGLDVHSTSCTMVVLGPSGRRLSCQVVETNASALIDLLKAIPRPRCLCMEEGIQSAWLYEVLSPHVDQLVVTVKTERRGHKNDERDAHGLAEQLRTNAIKVSVFKGVGTFCRLGQLARVHRMQVSDSVRTQNRIRSAFRARGVACNARVYSPECREDWIAKLPDSHRDAVRQLLSQYDQLEALREQASKALVSEARKHRAYELLQTIPGLGKLRVASLIPIVIDPRRFRTRAQFWSYCGLGVVMRSSSDWVRDKSGQWNRQPVQQTRGLNRNRNGALKAIFKGAAKTIVHRAEQSDPLYKHYQSMLQRGIKPNLADLTLARQVASIALAVWKTKEAFNPTRLNDRT